MEHYDDLSTGEYDSGGDLELACRGCYQLFVHPRHEQEFFAERGWPQPVRCLECRRQRRAERERA